MNKVILIGNLTSDPELRYTPQQIPVCTFTLAVNRRGGEEQKTDYFRITAWRQLGENCAKYLAKGRKAYVSGQVTANAYQARDGSARASLEVTASEVEFLSPRSEGPAPQRQEAAPTAPVETGFLPVETDELPF